MVTSPEWGCITLILSSVPGDSIQIDKHNDYTDLTFTWLQLDITACVEKSCINPLSIMLYDIFYTRQVPVANIQLWHQFGEGGYGGGK